MSANNGRPLLRHPLKVALGLGSAKDGTHHFLVQRVTAVALVFLVLYVVGLIISLVGADFATVRARVGHPVNATLLIAFIVANFWHARLGLQVIVEDYVHTAVRYSILQLLITFACWIAGLASVLAVVRVMLGA
ncbi:succinate dehydrogenase, hydrophobic membrane anchor protein [Lysobacter sp. TY2-98]|uniref:succinate dehydrogenase, hydrophobic membrane anchor protein n=1 Tax=Lysobacter sp. TY2-98 TaxID=2290922 RepID=UPI000E206CD7|nr:succinate dehydrogenase, hydrophobic membrane anchor protein [Lysobacter sp. TY2-98]AXK71627.1 succinate dehydrogenase, hydrophobic membrane anchor protein [Lysobacter sp. TY2-98]